MRLLVITQKIDVNDPVLGFFHRWVEEFAKNYEKVTVICLGKGEYDLPLNVKVLSLGKEEGKSRIEYLSRFYHYIWNERKNYDAVFVHMNQEYVLLGGVLWKMWNKTIVMWYVHRQTNLKLRIAEKFVDKIFTSTKESFRLESNKVYYLGHGIDIDVFKPEERNLDSRTLVSIGRITPIKNCEVLLKALYELRKSDPSWKVIFIGDIGTSKDEFYRKNLIRMIEDNNLKSNIEFTGPLDQEGVVSWLTQSLASVNMTPTGGMDKVVLESLATGCPAFVSNEAFKELLGDYASQFIFLFRDFDDLTKKLKRFTGTENKKEILEKLSSKVRFEYGIPRLVEKITKMI